MKKSYGNIFLVNGLSVNTDPEIISTQDEIITYINHTAKLSCIIQNRMRQRVRTYLKKKIFIE